MSASFNGMVLVMNHTDLLFCRILSQSLCDDRGEIQAIKYLDRHIKKDLRFREPVNTINDRISIIARPFLIASQNQSASSKSKVAGRGGRTNQYNLTPASPGNHKATITTTKHLPFKRAFRSPMFVIPSVFCYRNYVECSADISLAYFGLARAEKEYSL